MEQPIEQTVKQRMLDLHQHDRKVPNLYILGTEISIETPCFWMIRRPEFHGEELVLLSFLELVEYLDQPDNVLDDWERCDLWRRVCLGHVVEFGTSRARLADQRIREALNEQDS